jgi:hypothetical protein
MATPAFFAGVLADSRVRHNRGAQSGARVLLGDVRPGPCRETGQPMSDLKKAQKVAHAFRFMCSSYYMPGEQDWGAF